MVIYVQHCDEKLLNSFWVWKMGKLETYTETFNSAALQTCTALLVCSSPIPAQELLPTFSVWPLAEDAGTSCGITPAQCWTPGAPRKPWVFGRLLHRACTFLAWEMFVPFGYTSCCWEDVCRWPYLVLALAKHRCEQIQDKNRGWEHNVFSPLLYKSGMLSAGSSHAVAPAQGPAPFIRKSGQCVQ